MNGTRSLDQAMCDAAETAVKCAHHVFGITLDYSEFSQETRCSWGRKQRCRVYLRSIAFLNPGSPLKTRLAYDLIPDENPIAEIDLFWNGWSILASLMKRSPPSPRTMKKALFCLANICLISGSIYAGDLPKFDSDKAADQWMREHSPLYKSVASSVEAHGGYKFLSVKDIPRALTVNENGGQTIQLNDQVQGPKRVSLAAFELTNAYQMSKFQDLETEVHNGIVKDASEYAILRALIEMDGLKIHRQILEEIDKSIGGVPKEMFQWIYPGATTLAGYQIPPAFDYIRAQQNSPYRAGYEQLFREAVKPAAAKAN